MPQFTVELSDGTSIDLEADKQPTEQEVIDALKPLPTSAPGAFARAVATGIGPAAAGAAAFTPGMEIGAAAVPEIAPVSGLAGGLLSAGVAAGVAAWGQKKLLQATLPELATKLERLQSSDVEQHPYATAAGGIAAQLPSMEVALPKTLAEIPKRAAIQTGITAGQTIIGEGRLPTGTELGEAAIAGTVFGQPRKYLLPKGLAALRGEQYARSQQEAAKVHGDLRARAQQGAGQVPAQEGGAGVQPQAEAVAQAPQVLLTPEIRAVRNDDGTYTVTKKTKDGTEVIKVGSILDAKVAADELRAGKPVSVKQLEIPETPAAPMEMEASPEEIDAHRQTTAKPVTGRIMNPESGFVPKEELPIFQSALDANAQRGLSGNLRVVPGDPKNPGETAYPDFKTGEIVLNREAFDSDTIGMTPEEKADYVHALMAHEGFHLATPPLVAEQFWNALSGLEKKLYTRAYAGRRPLDQATADNPRLMGWEALRMRWERLQGMDRTEIIGAVKSEQWTQRGIDLMTAALENLHRLFRTAGSKVQQRILKEMTDKINTAREAAGMAVWKPEEAIYEQGPFARRRAGEVSHTDLDKMDDAQAAAYFNQIRKEGIPPQFDAVQAGIKLAPSDVPELERLRDESGRKMMDAIKSNDSTAQLAQMGKNVWYSGAIEGARKSGPNYHIAQLKRMRDLPPVQEGYVRLYHGEGGPAGAGMGALWYSTDPNRAATYGPQLSYVDVPQGISDAAWSALQKRGHGTATDRILPEEWLVRAQQVPGTSEPPTFDLTPAARRRVPKAEEIDPIEEHTRFKDHYLPKDLGSQLYREFTRLWSKEIFEMMGTMPQTREQKINDAMTNFALSDPSEWNFTDPRLKEKLVAYFDSVEGTGAGRLDRIRNDIRWWEKNIHDLMQDLKKFRAGYKGLGKPWTEQAMAEETLPDLPGDEWKHGEKPVYRGPGSEEPERTFTEGDDETPYDFSDLPWMRENAENGRQFLEKAEREYRERTQPEQMRMQLPERKPGEPMTGELPKFPAKVPTAQENLRDALYKGLPGWVQDALGHDRGYPLREQVLDQYAVRPRDQWNVDPKVKESLIREFDRMDAEEGNGRVGRIKTALYDAEDRLREKQFKYGIKDASTAEAVELYQQEVDRLSKLLGEATREFNERMGSQQGRFPFARRRGKKEPYDPEQEKLFPKNLTAMGVPGEVPTAEGRPSIQHPELTGKAIDDSIWENLASNRPGIEGMMGQMREKFWRDVSPTQVYETFRDKMWDYLLNVPGAELERIRRASKLESVLGTKPIADTTTPRSEQQREFNLSEASRKAKAAALRGEADQIERLAAAAPEKALETPGGELRGTEMALPGMGLPMPKPARRRPAAPTRGELLTQAKARRAEADIIERGSELETPTPERLDEQEKRRRQAEKYRRTNIGVIARKLLKIPDDQAQAVKVKLNREHLTFKDLGWWRDLPYRVFQEISEKEAAMPDVLGGIITRDARLGPTDPVSNSKRVVAFRNRETGEVHVVSAWLDGRRGALVTDPRMTGFRGNRPNTELTPELLNKWRAIYSMLTDEPLKDFHETFKGMEEFNAAIGKQATQYAMSETARAPFYKAAVGLAEEEGALVKGQPLTDTEAGKVISHIIMGGGFPKGPEDVELSLANLARKRDWPAVTGYQKIYDAFKARHPEMSPLEALNNLPKHIYDTWNIGKDEDSFKQAILGYVNAEAAQPVQPKPGTAAATQAGVTPTAREFAPFTPGQVPVSARERLMRKMRPPVPPTEKLPPPSKLPAETLPQEALEQIRAATEEKPIEQAAEVTPIAERKPSGKQAQLYTTKTEGGKEVRQIVPLARRRTAQRAEEEFEKAKSLLGAIVARKQSKEDVYRLRDGMSNDADVESRLGGSNVRATSQVRKDAKRAEQVRQAAKAVIATGELQAVTRAGRIKMVWAPNRATLGTLMGKVDAAIRDATSLTQKRNPIDRTIGRLWLKAARRLRGELEFAQANWNSSDLRDTVTTVRLELLKQFSWEKKNGSRLANRFNYFPGRYEAELFNDSSVFFGGMRVLGRNYRRPKAFANYYDAIAAGPYIPKNYDAANIVEHRLRQGRQEINKAMWMEMLKGINDPITGKPIVVDPVTTEIIDTPQGKIIQKIDPKPPDFEHELISLGPGKKTYAVRVGYKDTLEKAIGQSGIQQSATGRAALAMTRSLKHGALLIYDTFHPGRLLQYATAIMGGKELPGFKAGLAALDYREADLPKAVAAGLISQKSADWATGQVEINIGGVKMMRSRQEILRQAVREGFNVARHQDALFSDVKHVLPGVTEFNRLIFDRLTRGLMSTAMVKKFEEYQAKHPNIDSRVLLKDIAKDLNIFYGSMGRQGFIKNPTFRDIGQIMFLAPNWVEGLIQKEVRFYGRATGISQALGRTGVPRMGVLGKGMANGLMFYFGMAQIINLLTRGQFTWQNKEEGLDKKLSAWVPTAPDSPEGDGFWLSPLSVFAEVTHDLMRLAETKRNTWEAIRQIGYNKLGPWGRLGMVLVTRETARGERLPTSGTIAKEAALQLAPIPITLSSGIRYAAHEVAPETFPQLPKGRVMQQIIASGAGIKVTPGETAAKQVGRMATNFMQKENLRQETVDIVPTVNPSYSKLWQAVRLGDERGARAILKDLEKYHTDGQILEAAANAARRPFTGSHAAEGLFMESLSDEELKLYDTANLERMDDYQKFLDWYARQP